MEGKWSIQKGSEGGPAASQKNHYFDDAWRMPAPNADWTIRAEKKMKDSVRAKLLQSDTASSFFKFMTRNERVLMYTQYNLTGNKDMIKIKPLHAMNEKDIDLAASNFASWLIIQTKIYPSSGQEISAEKFFL